MKGIYVSNNARVTFGRWGSIHELMIVGNPSFHISEISKRPDLGDRIVTQIISKYERKNENQIS